ncbi:MAG: hypothetical protein DDT19_01547 [Syntrophomonadaceae bacterium]|nr:hypothetical protein [Bacillota bacterium]
MQGEAEQDMLADSLGADLTESEFARLYDGIPQDDAADQTNAERVAQQEQDDGQSSDVERKAGEAQPRGAEANPQGGESQPGRAAVQGADGAGQGARPDLSLARQTERDLAARERELNKREAEQNARERAALDKEKADRERDGFRLTGSDRAADANDGQGDLLGVKQNEPEFDRSANKSLFYSQLSRVIESAPGKVFTTANQFKAWLSANAAKLGVKKDEIAWSGIEEYLTLRGEAKVSKADIVAFLNESGVKVEDKDNLKYSDIVPPGGIPGTYRETLVTVPERQHPMAAEVRSLGITKPLNEVSYNDVVNAGGSERLAGRWMDSFSGIHFGENFISPHFDQKNILVHLRTDRVKAVDGRTFMRVVELQSEWHQARTQGKNVPDAPFSDTKAWVSLGIKKAIQQAVDSDVDGIVFATGKQNADLYDLSKKVGGEGMRVFYDEIVPSVANEVLKKLGIGRIAKVAVHDAQGLHNSIILTDTVRAKTRAEGLPLFQNIVKPEETPHTDPYDNLETRPNTSPEQLDTGRDALVSAERRIFGANRTGLLQDATLLGSAISKEFRENGGVSLVGQTIKGSRDLAVLAQVLRDPRFETFRVVYVDESNKIIKEGVYSSRLPGAVYLPQDIAAQIKADKEKVGAAGYWLMHNHPSGSSRESTQDLRLTERVSAMAPGFKGHVVIDHNEYNIIDVDSGRAFGQVVKDPSLGSIDLTANPEKSHPILGEQITSTESLAKLAKRLQQKDGYAVVIGVDAQSRVTFIAEVPDSDIRKARSVKALALVKRSMRETGSMALFAAVPDSPINYGSLIDSMIFTDIVQIESGESAAKNGWMKDKNIPVTKVEQRGAKAYSGQKPFGVASPETEYDAAGKGPRQTAGWRDELGRVQFAPAVRLKDAGKRALADFAAKGEIRQYLYNAFKLAPPKLQIAIRKMKAAEQRALELTDDVMRPAVSMTPQEAALISDVVEIMVKPGVYPPEHIVAVAERLRTIMNLETDELVETGMLTEEGAARWRGKYLPRFYDRKKDLLPETWGKIPGSRDVVRGMGGEHLKARGLPPMTVHVSEIGKWEALGWEVRDPAWEYRNGKLELKHPDKYLNDPDTVRMWRDYTPTERENMGEIRDARFRFAMGYTAMQKDIALGRLFDTIARNQEWTRPRAEEGYVHVPDTEIADTGGLKRYGNLAGLYVRKDIMSHLTQYGDSNKFLMLYREAMSVWKMGMVPMNPVSHVNNTVSNLTMAHLAGVSYWDVHKYAAALHDLSISAKNKKDEPMVQEARDIGLFTGDITRAEIYNEMPESLRDMMNMQESRLKKGAWLAYDLSTYFARRPMLAAYRFEDDFFKYLIYRDARNHGLKPEDAMIYATQYIFNYDDLPEGARAVRDTIIPFFAYTYKATPALIHAATHYPWRFLAPSVILSGYSMAVYSAMVMRMGAGGDDDMWDIWNKARELKAEDQKGLAPWERGRSIFLTDKTFRTGATDDRTGLPVFQNIYRWLPGGDLLDIRHGEMTTLPAPLMPSNPILSIAAATIPQINKNMFTGDEVVDETDTAAEVTKKRIHYVLRTLAPAISPTGYHADRLLNATANALDKTIETPFKDYTGVSKDGLPVQAKYAVAQSLGFKLRPVDLERQAEFEVIGDRAKVRKIKSELRSAARQRANGNISERQYQSELKKAKEKLARIGKEE